MKRIRLTWILMISITLMLFVFGQTNTVSAEKKVLTYGAGVDIVTFDPHNYKTATDLSVMNLVFENLVAFDSDLNVRPALAESWDNIDATTWRFKLRKGVKFHDGTSFNAEAAKVNFERMIQSPRASSYFGMITSVTIEDENTIILKTKVPYAPFLKNLCHPVGGIMSPKAIAEYGKDIGTNPVGTGRFKLKEWRVKEKLTLVKNENYWGKKALLDEFIFRPIPEEGTRAMAFESGEIDVLSDPLPHRLSEYKANKNMNVITGPAARVVWVGFNVGDKLLSNIKLRQAIAYAINRDDIVKYVLQDYAINAKKWIPNIVQESNKEYHYDYNLEKAKEFLKEAGYSQGIELNLWTPEGRYLKDRQIAEAVQDQLLKIGINAKLKVLEWGAYMDSCFRHEQQVFIIGWSFQVGDPDTLLRDNFYSSSKWNYSDYKSSEMDKILDEAVSTLDSKIRAGFYEKVQQKLIDDVIGVPIYHRMNIFVTNKKVKNFFPHPMELISLDETTIE
jgi:peptide/nickel transport system substrate-binding protein